MITIIGLLLFSLALMVVAHVFAATLLPALPRIIALLRPEAASTVVRRRAARPTVRCVPALRMAA